MSQSEQSCRAALVRYLFDYAGMFPPASLTFEDAVRESASLKQALTFPSLVASDLVLDLDSARILIQHSPSEHGFRHSPRICLLASESPHETIAVAHGLANRTYPDNLQYVLGSIEVRIKTATLATTVEAYHDVIASQRSLLALEPSLEATDWSSVLTTTVEAIKNMRTKLPNLALKVRCGGPTAIDASKLARVIALTCDEPINLKATAGLHHPIVEPERYGNVFGFLNLAAAIIFRRVLRDSFDNAACLQLLTNRSSHALGCDESLTFESFRLSLEQVQTARRAAHFSIGTCSVREPDQDLLRLFGAIAGL